MATIRYYRITTAAEMRGLAAAVAVTEQDRDFFDAEARWLEHRQQSVYVVNFVARNGDRDAYLYFKIHGELYPIKSLPYNKALAYCRDALVQIGGCWGVKENA